MFKKYLPYTFLLAAALLLFFIRKNQRGPEPVKPSTGQTDDRITVPAVLPGEKKPEEIKARPPARAGKDGDDLAIRGFNRDTKNLIFSKHARCRMDCRKIDEREVREILINGMVNEKKIQKDKRGITYPVEGFTHDKQNVRIVFAPRGDALVVVTVIDLDKEWSCDCK